MTWFRRLRLGGNSGVLIVFIVLVLAGFGLIRPAYLTGSNLSNILVQATPVAIAAIGMTYVILLADIDLSIGSTMYLSVVVATMLTSSSSALMITPSVWVYPVAIVTGLILGSVNAALISVLRINALIVSLGALYAYQGIGLALTGAGTQLTSGPRYKQLHLKRKRHRHRRHHIQLPATVPPGHRQSPAPAHPSTQSAAPPPQTHAPPASPADSLAAQSTSHPSPYKSPVPPPPASNKADSPAYPLATLPLSPPQSPASPPHSAAVPSAAT